MLGAGESPAILMDTDEWILLPCVIFVTFVSSPREISYEKGLQWRSVLHTVPHSTFSDSILEKYGSNDVPLKGTLETLRSRTLVLTFFYISMCKNKETNSILTNTKFIKISHEFLFIYFR
mgnify:CR=1 FL=1